MAVRARNSLTRTKVLTVPAEIFAAPDGEQTEFTVKYADNRAVLARMNLFDEVRYVSRDADGETETIRSFPMGDLRLYTVKMVLLGWNIQPAKDQPTFPITEDTIQDLLDPAELAWLYDQVIDMNPVWGGTEAGES